ncbi:MAG TPA: FkbM family methyltransferase [Edaphobacter sp.]|nr:FkbM family methyltransferase [Edaphobacter sp.]
MPVPRLLLGKPVWIHYRLLSFRHNEPHVLRWIVKTLRPGDVCFDVGAHHGWMSMVAARQTGHKGRVVAFEPAPALVEFLSYHKRLNRLPQIEIVPKAVSYRDGSGMPFHLIGDGNSFMNYLSGLNIPENSLRGESSIEVETVTLDTFSRLSGLIPNLIKIDTEGAELWVCQGARHLLATHRPALILATHPLWLPEGQRIEELFELLHDLGYRIVDSVVYEYGNADFGDYLFVAD